MKSLIFLASFLFLNSAMASTTFTWSIDSELNYFTRAAREFKTEIEKETKGRIKIDIVTYDAETAKAKTDYVEVQEGKYHIAQTVVGDFAHYVPEFKVWNMPFLFKDDQHLENYIVGPVARAMMNKLETNSVLPIDYTFSGGFLHTFCNKKINSFSEVPENKLNLAIDTGFGSDFLAPRKIQSTRIMDADEKIKCSEVLGAGVVDLLGREDSKDLVYNITNHRVIARILFVSKAQLNKVSEKDRKVFLDKLRAYAIRERQYSVEGKDLSIAVLVNRGHNIHHWDKKTIDNEKQKFSGPYSKYKAWFPDAVGHIEQLPAKDTKKLVKKEN